jgi:hypothetical protein
MKSVSKKKSPHKLSRALSDHESQKNPYSLKTKFLNFDKSDTQDSKKIKLSMHDSKIIHNINLQIPSLNSPSSLSLSNKPSKKTSYLNGFSSKIGIKSSKTITKKKKIKKPDNYKLSEDLSNTKKDSESFETKLLEDQIKQALQENKRLKKLLQKENSTEDVFEDLMRSFKSRLYKLLYE